MGPSTVRLPAIYVNHGGGPMPLIGQQPSVARFLSSYAATLPSTPAAVLVATAHWEEAVTTVSGAASHRLLFDYGGFPPETYAYTYPAPGSPAIAKRVCQLLSAARLPNAIDERRGWDHGVFVPMMLMFPSGSVPIVQLSLTSSQDAATHLAVGAALRPLRDEGVLIVGSGVSFHNFSHFFASDRAKRDAGVAHSRAFDAWLTATMTDPALSHADRIARLAQWDHLAPSAREAHPPGAAEHLLPALVVAGAAGDDGPATKVGSGKASPVEAESELLGGFAFSQFEFRS